MIDRKQMERLLARTTLSIGDVVFADYLARALTLLNERQFDILLLDLNLPDSFGLDTLVTLEKSHPNVPKIVVTGEGNEKLGLEAVAKGTQDYLVKDRFSIDALSRVIRYSMERKKSEEALRESRGKLNAMLESINDPMVMVDKDLNIIWSNEAIKRLSGEDPTGKKCYQIYHGKDKPCEANPCVALQSFRDGNPHDGDVVVVDKEDQTRYFHFTANVALRDKDGQPAAVIEIARDITDRKTAEIIKAAYVQVEQANRELKEMQSQLVQNEKLASIGQFAAGVAHEMNTPVGFVACNFETLDGYMKKICALMAAYDELVKQAEAADTAARLETVHRIKELKEKMRLDFILKDLKGLFDDSREGLDRVTKIIQNLRDFSRVDQAGDFSEYDINEGIKATLTVARNEIKYDADLKTEFGDIPHVFCNPGQINQVILNIVVNAAQAIKSQQRQTKGLITIRTYQADADIVCQIEDDGPGIPPENLRKVFDPFFTTKPAGKGTGLGLSVSHDIIVNKHKGQLSVESEVNQGTLFTIRVPIKGPENVDDSPKLVLSGVQANG